MIPKMGLPPTKWNEKQIIHREKRYRNEWKWNTIEDADRRNLSGFRIWLSTKKHKEWPSKEAYSIYERNEIEKSRSWNGKLRRRRGWGGNKPDLQHQIIPDSDLVHKSKIPASLDHCLSWLHQMRNKVRTKVRFKAALWTI